MIYHDNRPFAMILGQNVLLQNFPVCIIFVGISLGFCWDFARSSLKFRWVFWPRFVTYLKLAAASATILATMRWSYTDKPLQPIQRCFQTPISTIYFSDKSCRNTFCHKQHLVKMFFLMVCLAKRFLPQHFATKKCRWIFVEFSLLHTVRPMAKRTCWRVGFSRKPPTHIQTLNVCDKMGCHISLPSLPQIKKPFIPAHCKSCRRTLQYATNYIFI